MAWYARGSKGKRGNPVSTPGKRAAGLAVALVDRESRIAQLKREIEARDADLRKVRIELGAAERELGELRAEVGPTSGVSLRAARKEIERLRVLLAERTKQLRASTDAVLDLERRLRNVQLQIETLQAQGVRMNRKQTAYSDRVTPEAPRPTKVRRRFSL